MQRGIITRAARMYSLWSSDQVSVAVRAKMAWRRNLIYERSEKLWALIASRNAKKILLSGNPDWVDAIKTGFSRLPHQVEEGPINKDSYQLYDIVVPLSLAAIEEARRHSSALRNALPLPSAESVSLCDDKYEFNQVLAKAGFGRYIPRMTHGLGLTPPYILKRRIGAWGKGCHIIRNFADEEAQLHHIADPKYFCQELIQGSTEFATHILFVEGKVVKALNIKYEFAGDMSIKGQDSFLFQVVHRCSYLDLFARMLRAIQFEGLCCVNYKLAKGLPFLLEINPRMGGSLAPYFFSFIKHLRCDRERNTLGSILPQNDCGAENVLRSTL